jgi:hypothetical protein
MHFVHVMLCCRAVLALSSVVAPCTGQAKEKAQSSLQAGSKAVKKHASVFDRDGYRLVSPNSTMRCAQTLRGTLDCKE